MRRKPHNAGGADLWTPEQLSWVSVEAAAPLAEMLNRIEQGAQWPRQLRTVFLSYLAKTEEHSTAPLQYRGISLLPS
eukprot:9263547-Alexandrium_andersonii.AAC.1